MTQNFSRIGGVALLGLLWAASPAIACKPAPGLLATPEARQKVARDAVNSAAAIIDATVVQSERSATDIGQLKAKRVLKGRKQKVYRVGRRHSCHAGMPPVGSRLRVILTGGPDVYYISALPMPDAEVDRLLKSDRRKVWPEMTAR